MDRGRGAADTDGTQVAVCTEENRPRNFPSGTEEGCIGILLRLTGGQESAGNARKIGHGG